MAVYSTSFSEYSTGSAPSDWTKYWEDNWVTLEIQAGASNYGGQFLTVESGYLCSFSWDDVGTPTDVDLYATFRGSIGEDITDRGNLAFLVRGSGADSTETCYGLRFVPDVSGYEVSLFLYNSGSYQDLVAKESYAFSNETWYDIRFQVSGTSIKGKVWSHGDSEPALWTIEATNSTVAGSGWVGINVRDFTEFDFDYLSVATGGDTPEWPGNDLNVTLPDLQILAREGNSVIANLPALNIEAGRVSVLDSSLPELTIDAKSGFLLIGDNILSELQITATSSEIHLWPGNFPDYHFLLPELRFDGEFGSRLSLNEKFPTFNLVGFTGARSGEFNLPDLALASDVIETIVTDPITCTLNSLFPPIKIETESLTGNFYFDLKLPGLKFQSISRDNLLTTLSFDLTLSDFRVDSSSYKSSLVFDNILPVIFMSSISYGDSSNPGSSTIIDSTLFDDLLLRYSRWPS